ncbi:hypothetical protein F9U64_10565 [Gracilibacillus oryzae]|uniref:Lipoprotein n=1 Tax=Gracilibacillus oryzae TaxID=1672701 RepID=A0A7C8KTS9_9BACI|nr:hypothetical protein [Gracilibacillus oryzae]KAB8135713.1 hypothetical protein F9U64_10565 [Gracilibacillus oryzae]
MNRKIAVLLGSLFLLLAACGVEDSKTFTFSEETEDWSANLKVTQTNDDYETQDLVLEYKGVDVNSVGKFTYHVDSVGSFGESGATLNDQGVLKESSEANPTNAKVDENTQVEVRVNWNGKTETFNLDRVTMVEVKTKG